MKLVAAVEVGSVTAIAAPWSLPDLGRSSRWLLAVEFDQIDVTGLTNNALTFTDGSQPAGRVWSFRDTTRGYRPTLYVQGPQPKSGTILTNGGAASSARIYLFDLDEPGSDQLP